MNHGAPVRAEGACTNDDARPAIVFVLVVIVVSFVLGFVLGEWSTRIIMWWEGM